MHQFESDEPVKLAGQTEDGGGWIFIVESMTRHHGNGARDL